MLITWLITVAVTTITKFSCFLTNIKLVAHGGHAFTQRFTVYISIGRLQMFQHSYQKVRYEGDSFTP